MNQIVIGTSQVGVSDGCLKVCSNTLIDLLLPIYLKMLLYKTLSDRVIRLENFGDTANI